MPGPSNPNAEFAMEPIKGYDPTGHQVAVVRVANITTDNTVSPPVTYGDFQINIVDGVTPSQKATVAQFHNADNQALPVTAYGLLTGGVAQVINASNNLDRSREAGQDNITAQGVPQGTVALGQYNATTSASNIIASTSAQAIVVTNAGTLAVGDTINVDSGANFEAVYVTAVAGTSISGVFTKNHNGSVTAFLVWYFKFNQERDASGENSGASGKGTAVAAGYEETSGGPPLANGTPSLLRYDREVAALGKATVNAGAGFVISSTLVGDTILTPTVAANFKTLTPGQWIQLSGSGTLEYVRVADSYIISTAPSPIPLTSPVVNAGQTTAIWDAFGAAGPGQNPILLTGEGLEGVILNDRTKPGFSRMLQGNPAGEASVTVGGLQTTSIAAGVTTNTVIKATPGRIARILVTTTGTNPLQVFDNATTNSGTIIAALPASPAIGAYDFQFPAANGITVAGNAANPAITVSWS